MILQSFKEEPSLQDIDKGNNMWIDFSHIKTKEELVIEYVGQADATALEGVQRRRHKVSNELSNVEVYYAVANCL